MSSLLSSRSLRLFVGLALLFAAHFALAAETVPAPTQRMARLKDISSIEGIRDNQLVGYGLVVGLNGTGDTLNNIPFTKQSLQAMLERMGVNIRGATIRTGNVAASASRTRSVSARGKAPTTFRPAIRGSQPR